MTHWTTYIMFTVFLLGGEHCIGQTTDTMKIFLIEKDTSFYNFAKISGSIYHYTNPSDTVFLEIGQSISGYDMGVGTINGTFKFRTTIPDGTYLIYSNSKIIHIATFENNMKSGKWIYYHYSNYLTDEGIEDYKAERNYYYKDDRVTLVKEIHSYGGEIDSAIFYHSKYDHADSLIHYWSNGTMKFKCHYNEHNKATGAWKYWDRTGVLIKEEFFKDGKFIERKIY